MSEPFTDFKMFPVLWSNYRLGEDITALHKAGVPYMPVCIPWDMLTPHADQAQKNHGQTLACLASRGGLSPCEALAILDNRRWHKMPIETACFTLCERIAAWVTEEIRRADAF